MYKKSTYVLLAVLAVAFCSFTFLMQKQEDPWTAQQLMQPADLAAVINNSADKRPVVFNIGPAGEIKNSIEIGGTGKKENLAKLKAELTKIPKNKTVVIYCGCCPFVKCPNVRPAFNLLKEMKFTDPKLLNLPQNLKTDWIDKGFPMEE